MLGRLKTTLFGSDRAAPSPEAQFENMFRQSLKEVGPTKQDFSNFDSTNKIVKLHTEAMADKGQYIPKEVGKQFFNKLDNSGLSGPAIIAAKKFFNTHHSLTLKTEKNAYANDAPRGSVVVDAIPVQGDAFEAARAAGPAHMVGVAPPQGPMASHYNMPQEPVLVQAAAAPAVRAEAPPPSYESLYPVAARMPDRLRALYLFYQDQKNSNSCGNSQEQRNRNFLETIRQYSNLKQEDPLYNTYHVSPEEFAQARVALNGSMVKLDSPEAIKAAYRNLRIQRDTTKFREQKAVAGAANVAAEIMKNDPNAKLGVMVAANSGQPFGDLGHGLEGRKADKTAANLITKGAQEESVCSNMLMATCGNDPSAHKAFYESNIKNRWGLDYDKPGNMTRQGIDFTTATDPSVYNTAYVVRDVKMSAVTQDGRGNKSTTGTPYNVHQMVFSAGPNAGAKGSEQGSMARTLNPTAMQSYNFTREGIKFALRSGLDAMASGGSTHALVAKVSTGLYGGAHRGTLQNDFGNILQEVLNEKVGPHGEKRGQYFQDVVIPDVL